MGHCASTSRKDCELNDHQSWSDREAMAVQRGAGTWIECDSGWTAITSVQCPIRHNEEQRNRKILTIINFVFRDDG